MLAVGIDLRAFLRLIVRRRWSRTLMRGTVPLDQRSDPVQEVFGQRALPNGRC